MSVRAKFRCTSINEWKYAESDGEQLNAATVTFKAVRATDSHNHQTVEENKQFGKYTPNGDLSMGIVNEAAWRQFSVGDEYYLDITKAPNTEGLEFPWIEGDKSEPDGKGGYVKTLRRSQP